MQSTIMSYTQLERPGSFESIVSSEVYNNFVPLSIPFLNAT